MIFICIWAEDINHGIAKNNSIPWFIKQELAFFKLITINHAILMGKNTLLSINKPLIKRKHYVLSNTLKATSNDWYEIYCNKQELIKHLTANHSNEVVYVIGGKQIYDSFVNESQYLFVSKIKSDYECDLLMNINYSDFEIIKYFDFDLFQLHVYRNKKTRIFS